MISQRGIWDRKTSLTMPPFIELSVPGHESFPHVNTISTLLYQWVSRVVVKWHMTKLLLYFEIGSCDTVYK
jgi:hypothetical protein